MPAAGDVARTSLLLIFAFAGIECALVPSGEVRDTARTVPRAIALAMIVITLLYIALQVVAQGILGDDLAQSTAAPLAEAAGMSMGGWARSLLLAGASISTFGYLGGMTLSMPRMLFALARDGFLPRALAAVHPEHRTPQTAIVVQSILTLALGGIGHLRTARDPRQRVGARALLRLRARGVAPASARRGRRGRRHSHACRRRGAMDRLRGHPVAADRRDVRRVARLRDLRRRGVADLQRQPRRATTDYRR